MNATRNPKRTGIARLFTPGWIFLHILALTLIPMFLWLGYWQLSRAQGGNALSWGYALEWPVFALFTLALWIRQIRAEMRTDRADRKGQPTPAEQDQPPPMRSPWERDIIAAREREGSGI
ncbi:hypothetical protein [Haloglycomyces albus]|uniref:hypothetical protein n=1 Tax=Haloglycomyces albus TaxID=526067 RepID=UPI0004B10383|nr:hypothetical protein [Haloglycomyces albus]